MHNSSSLAHAAQRLAEAVATLADVAQAVSAAANAFSLEVLAHEPKSTIPAPIPIESVPIVLYESESESSTIDEAPSVAYATGIPGKVGSICSEETEYTNPEDSDYYQLDVANDDQVSVFHSNEQTNGTRTEGADRPPSPEPISIDQPRSDPTHRPSAIPEGAFSDVVTELNQGYHILVDNEADVLLFVCALLRAREGLKAICYMSCSLPAFNLYKKLINDVTGSPTYAVTKTTPAELESVGKSFIEGNNGVLLLPETVCPDIKLGNTDSWVIHIGWPVDEQKFDEQRKTHEAQHNILIGCSADENLYPAGYAAMWESLPWPGDTDSFRLSVGTLRPLFNGKLDLIPIQMKEKIYPDWIASHGSRGRRYVRSWTSSDLVGRANNYLLDVLRYHDPSEAPHSDSTQANLPEVSAGFVAHNGLEWAVEEGLLHIKSSPGINHISSHLKTHLLTPDTAQISDAALGDTASLGFSGPGQGDEHTTGPTSAFQPTPGFTYLVLQEEFDAIPLICFLATTTEAKKTILFVEDAESTPSYKLLLHEITGNLFITPDLVHDDQSREDAALQFLVYRGSAILLMSYKCKKLPTRLHDTPVDYCIYWGEGNFAPLLQAKKHRPRLDCRSTIVIMTNYQKVKLEKSLRDIQAHPSSADLLNPNQSPWLAATRDITKSCLNSKKDIVRGLYEARLRCLAGVPRDVKSAEEIVYEANQYAARVLLRGDPEDGSQTFPPVGGMIAVPSSMVRALKLQSAVTAGLLMVLA